MQPPTVPRIKPFPTGLPLLAAFTLLAASFVFELWRHLGAAGDFWTFWAAARAVRAGLDPYVPTALTRGAAPPAGAVPGPFLSPLFLAQAMQPLGALPLGAARLVWLALNLALSGPLVLLLLRLGGLRPTWRAVLTGAALLMAFQPYDLTLWLGQTDVIVVTAIAAGWLCMERGRPFLGGLVLSLAAVDVHLVAGVGLYLLFAARTATGRRALLGMAAGVSALGAVCLVHPADVTRWLLVTLPHAQASAIEPWDTLSVLQAASEMLGRPAGGIAAAALDVGMIGLAWSVWRRRAGTAERDLAVAAGLTLATTTFAYNQDYLLLVLAFPFLAQQWRRNASGLWTGALAFALAAGYGLAELTGGLVAPSHAAFIIGAPLMALAVLACVPALRARIGRVHLLWAGAWVAATVGGYVAVLGTRSEIGAEVMMLAGVLAFMALVGLGGAHGTESGGERPPARDPGRAQQIPAVRDATAWGRQERAGSFGALRHQAWSDAAGPEWSEPAPPGRDRETPFDGVGPPHAAGHRLLEPLSPGVGAAQADLRLAHVVPRRRGEAGTRATSRPPTTISWQT